MEMMQAMPVISTGHLNERDAVRVNCGAYQGPAWLGLYGWIFAVLDDEPENFDDGYQSLRDVFAWARTQGFDYVRLDSDAEAVDGLATYEW